MNALPSISAFNAAVEAIRATLDVEFAALDLDFIASSQAWAKGRVEALRAFDASDECKALREDRRNSDAYYSRRFKIAGGKTWFNVFYGRNAAMIAEYVEKACRRTIAARNNTISSKLVTAGIVSVSSSTFAHTRDGFNGVFVVETNAGLKRVKIETIVAGGYAIQCRHQRTLIRVS